MTQENMSEKDRVKLAMRIAEGFAPELEKVHEIQLKMQKELLSLLIEMGKKDESKD